MDKLRLSDALFHFLYNFREELGKNEDEIRVLCDKFVERLYKEH